MDTLVKEHGWNLLVVDTHQLVKGLAHNFMTKIW